MEYMAILKVSDLIEFCKLNERNIGITASGEIYRYNFDSSMAVRVSFEDAKKELKFNDETMLNIVNSGGAYKIPTPIIKTVDNADNVGETANGEPVTKEEKEVVHEDQPEIVKPVKEHEEEEPVECKCGCGILLEEQFQFGKLLDKYIEKFDKLQKDFDELNGKILL